MTSHNYDHAASTSAGVVRDHGNDGDSDGGGGGTQFVMTSEERVQTVPSYVDGFENSRS